jgi:hypothetical protein
VYRAVVKRAADLNVDGDDVSPHADEFSRWADGRQGPEIVAPDLGETQLGGDEREWQKDAPNADNGGVEGTHSSSYREGLVA